MINYWKNDSGGELTFDQAVIPSDGKFDVLQSARWHRLQFAWLGDVETSGFNVDLQPEGPR